MRVTIATRIFEPEPSAASYRLEALAAAFADAGHEVQVLTARPPKRLKAKPNQPFIVKRFPVLRDPSGYVRGYLQYMSFDIPLFFRLLFSKRSDVIICEPPPTTGFVVRLVSWFKRTPYAYYAADIWSDAAESTGAIRPVIGVLRTLEKWAFNGAQHVLSVNDGVSERVHQIGKQADVTTIGNGVDTSVFTVANPYLSKPPYFIYAGTASEWQGAGIFIQAFATIAKQHNDARIMFLGQGSDWSYLQNLAEQEIPGRADFLDTVPPQQAAELMRSATASLASIRPDSGYSFAFPTKVFASWASGTPIIYAGLGPVRTYMSNHSKSACLGEDCSYDVSEIAELMQNALVNTISQMERTRLGAWAADNVSLRAVAERAVSVLVS